MLDREELAMGLRPRGVDLISGAEQFAKGVVDNVEGAVKGAVHNVDVDLRHFVGGSAEEAANAIASAFNGPLAGTHISNGKVVGPLSEVFGAEPVEFASNAVRFQLAKSVQLVQRVAQHRLNKTSLSIKNPATGKVLNVSLKVTAASPTASIALAIAAEMSVDTVAVFDEVHRIMANIPPGKGRGIDGVLMPRGFFGIDDVIFWPCAITLLVGLLPFLIPALGAVASNVSSVVGGHEDIPTAFGNVFSGKAGATTGTAADNAKAGAGGAAAPGASGGFSLFGLDQTTLMILGAGLVLVLVLAFKKKHHGGPPPAPVPAA